MGYEDRHCWFYIGGEGEPVKYGKSFDVESESFIRGVQLVVCEIDWVTQTMPSHSFYPVPSLA